MTTPTEEYITSDYYISTALLASNENLIGHKKDETGKLIWIFEERESLTVVVQNYYNGNLVLPLSDVFQAQRLLKNQIKQSKSLT